VEIILKNTFERLTNLKNTVKEEIWKIFILMKIKTHAKILSTKKLSFPAHILL